MHRGGGGGGRGGGASCTKYLSRTILLSLGPSEPLTELFGILSPLLLYAAFCSKSPLITEVKNISGDFLIRSSFPSISLAVIVATVVGSTNRIYGHVRSLISGANENLFCLAND